MKCKEVQDRIKEFILGELPPGRMRQIDLHLGGCRACRSAQAEARRAWDVVIPNYFVAAAHDELTPNERTQYRDHLAWCEPCRRESRRAQLCVFEIIKNLSQYMLPRNFRALVMQEWKPHRVGSRSPHLRHNFADLIERAESGNVFTYERLVDRFKDYAYLSAFLVVGDFPWAADLARTLFVKGFPVMKEELTQLAFLRWIDRRMERLAERSHWGNVNAQDAEGLSGYTKSHKLRRHSMILNMYRELGDEDRIPFLLYNVQRMKYIEIASALELDRKEVLARLDRATQTAVNVLRADDQAMGTASSVRSTPEPELQTSHE